MDSTNIDALSHFSPIFIVYACRWVCLSMYIQKNTHVLLPSFAQLPYQKDSLDYVHCSGQLALSTEKSGTGTNLPITLLNSFPLGLCTKDPASALNSPHSNFQLSNLFKMQDKKKKSPGRTNPSSKPFRKPLGTFEFKKCHPS